MSSRMPEPMISVLMPVYKIRLDWLAESVESILNQTYANFEFLIINDNPEDSELKSTLQKFEASDNRIKVLYNSKNLGISQSLNKAIVESKGKYIARMDADDIALPQRFEKQLLYLEEKPKIDLLGGQVVKIDSEQNRIGISNNPISPKLIKRISKYLNPTTHPTWMMKRDALIKLGFYRDMPNSEDYDLLLRMIDSGWQINNLSETLIKYRVHNTSQSMGKAVEQRACIFYAKKLSRQRAVKGVDCFDTQELCSLLSENSNSIDPIYRYHSSGIFGKIYALSQLVVQCITQPIDRQYFLSQGITRIIKTFS